MAIETDLDSWLDQQGSSDLDRAVASTVKAIAGVALGLSHLVSLGSLAGDLAATSGAVNADGDAQRELDLIADERFARALGRAPVAFMATEEREDVVVLDPDAPLAVAIDPLDGSSNIDTNVSIGTIFSILPVETRAGLRPVDHVLRPGSAQIAAGFVVYGPQTSLVLSIGRGVQIFIADRATASFRLAKANVSVPVASGEFALNLSNRRHWDKAIRAYADDCLEGEDGPLGKNFNMRWIASLVAEAYRILMRGGVFLYPGDARKGYRNGRLRLVYEANPIAFLMEQANGAATDGLARLLDIRPTSLHARTPLVFGSAENVEQVGRYHNEPHGSAQHSPLFGRRGLLRV